MESTNGVTHSSHVETDTKERCRAAALSDLLRRAVRGLHYRPSSGDPLLELPVMQLRSLNAIAEHEGERLVDLSTRVGVGLPGASRMVDRLVRQGMVIREPDQHDRRAIRLQLTPRARKSLDDLRAARIAHIRRAVRDLDSVTLDTILTSLQILADAADRLEPEAASASPDALGLNPLGPEVASSSS